jgi:hypothetical protein
MIATTVECEKARDELRALEDRLERLQQTHPGGSKGLTKARIRKMIARLHEELALYEGAAGSETGRVLYTSMGHREDVSTK